MSVLVFERKVIPGVSGAGGENWDVSVVFTSFATVEAETCWYDSHDREKRESKMKFRMIDNIFTTEFINIHYTKYLLTKVDPWSSHG